jgi:cell pole-organizing protein PopZ
MRVAVMNQPAKAQEPTMEEILASIRRIIADDDATKPKSPETNSPETKTAEAPKPVPPPAPKPAPPPAPAVEKNSQDDIDAMFATGFDAEPEPEPEPPPPPPPPPPKAEPPADILDLTEAMEAPEPPSFRRIEPNPDVVFRESTPEPPPPPPPPPPSTFDHARRRFEEHTEIDRSLMSSATAAAVDSAFNSLATTVLVQNSRTLDDLVREMLRPMLKAWLDDNLPGMVERLVRAEIERVSRGRG